MNLQLGACLLSLLGLSFLGNVSAFRSLGPAPTSCTELLQDGGFEAGGQGWLQQSVQGYDLISDFNPHTGRLGAYLAGVNEADDRLSQQVDLPAGATVILQAWWFLATAETAGSFDTMTVSLLRPNGELLADLVTVDNTADVGIWDQLLLDLTPYAGQAVVLRFRAVTDATNISDFYVDDVSVVACAADVTPTNTVAPTATSTLTVTPIPTATATSTGTATVTTAPNTSTPTATTTTAVPGTSTPTATSTASPIGTGVPVTSTPTATPLASHYRQYLPYIAHY